MNNRIRRAIRAHHRQQHARAWLAMLPLAAIVAMPDALAQTDTEASVTRLEEVIVSARRKDEMLQDVPLTVNVVDESAINNLNLRQLADLKNVVAGLTLAEDPIAPNASMRGVRFDSFASGNNSTVEFYLNDSPIVSAVAMQALFDISQIEVLRGPQGTLRGRASPSGAINLTTQQPDLENFGGYIDATKNNLDGHNVRAAVNVPILQDRLGLRVAGFTEESQAGGFRSVTSGKKSAYDGDGFRGTLRFKPVDTLSFNLLHQRVTPKRFQNTQVESASLEDPAQGSGPTLIKPGDRHGVTDIRSASDQVQERTGLEVAWEVTDTMVLNYAGALTEQELVRKAADDSGDVFGPGYPQALQEIGQQLRGDQKSESHELRFTSEFERADVVVGALYQKFNSTNNVEQQTPVFLFSLSPGSFATVAKTPVISDGESVEKSIFGNVTYHITDATEISAGLRYIDFTNESSVNVAGNTISSSDDNWSETVYMLSVNHSFSPDLMVYGTLGSSWRPGINTVGNFSTALSAREQSFIQLDPETSESLELGVKSSMLDSRLRLNGAVFYQQFDNYPYRSGGSGVYYVSTNPQGVESVESFNFVAAVPVNVYGLELELAYQIMDNWNFSALYSWSKGELDGATIPCADYLPADGRPDAPGQIPTIGDIRAATGGDNVAACSSNARANFAPLWTTTLQSEYSLPLNIGAEAYVRGLLTIYGRSQNDPSNALDDVSSYTTFNLYTGLRSDSGAWEVMLYGKNLFETERVLSRGANPISQGYQMVTGVGPSGAIVEGRTAVSGYREISMTEPREFGVNVRYNF